MSVAVKVMVLRNSFQTAGQ